MIGFEGMTGIAIIPAASRSALDTRVRLPGDSFRVEATKLVALFDQCVEMRETLLTLANAMLNQVMQATLASGMDTIDTHRGAGC